MGRATARLSLLALVALILGGALAPARPLASSRGPFADDLTLYEHIVSRVHAGESYWDAAEIELRRGHYPMRPVFTWRPPLYAWLFGALPSVRVGQALLVALAAFALLLGYRVTRPHGLAVAVIAALFQAGVFAAAGSVYLSTELWAGVLIALSAAAYADQRPRLGFGAALAALFFRELALPWCLVCLVRASRRERLAWLGGLAAFAGYFGLHASRVAAHLANAGAAGAARSWLALGGIGFVESTLRANLLFFAAPIGLLAIVLALSLLGAGALPPALDRARLGVLVYVVAFALVGLPINFYWGLTWVPLLGFGAAWSVPSLRALVRAAR